MLLKLHRQGRLLHPSRQLARSSGCTRRQAQGGAFASASCTLTMLALFTHSFWLDATRLWLREACEFETRPTSATHGVAA